MIRIFILRQTMQLVLIYAAGALIAALMAYTSGPETPVVVFWLYVAGAVFFALGAAGQYLKRTNAGR
jgi:predicted ABC-type sugar transport system permease subunit